VRDQRSRAGERDDEGRRAEDARWMALALRLATLGMGGTHPNPRVGAVAVRDGRPLARGAHLVFGGPHAERALIASAGEGALEGATVYVNLEPCAHQGKTPPCAPALARARVARVVAAIADPHPLVDGRGLAVLREAGVDVKTGVLARSARRLNAPFLWNLRSGRALLTLKIASSLDGRLAAADGSSRWISGAASRERVHRWRARCDAIVVGRGTFLADRPRLTARPERDPQAHLRSAMPGAGALWPHQPARVVIDSRAALGEAGSDDFPPAGAGATGAPWVVACGRQAPSERRRRLEERGVRCWLLPEDGGGAGVDLVALARRLAGEGWLDVMVEGGAAVAGSLLAARLVDRLRLFLAPFLLGGPRTWTGDLGVAGLKEAVRWAEGEASPSGEDLLVTCWSEALARLFDGAPGAALQALKTSDEPRTAGDPGRVGRPRVSPRADEPCSRD